LSSFRVSFLHIAVCACVLIVTGLGLAPAHAAVPPDNIAEAITEAEQACRVLGGIPNTDAVLSVEDLNGDGGEDWIADFAKMKCDGAGNPLCNNEGCTLYLYFWDGGVAWDLVFEDFVKSYKFSSSGDTRTMHVTTSGVPCNKPIEETCAYTYRLDKEAVVPMQ
jgi:hypothetical protein